MNSEADRSAPGSVTAGLADERNSTVSVTSALFRAARLSATARAVRRGRAPQRVANIAIGRVIGRLTRGLWR